jgi:hypothetical protein
VPVATHRGNPSAMTRLSHEEMRIGVAARLRLRNAEIEEAIVARIRDVSPDSPGDGDVQYWSTPWLASNMGKSVRGRFLQRRSLRLTGLCAAVLT